jgi:acyl carrier protein
MPSNITSAELVEEVREVVRDALGDTVDSVLPDANLAASLGSRYDSLTAMEVIVAVERAFAVEVDFVADDIRQIFATLRNIAAFVASCHEDAAAGGRQ